MEVGVATFRQYLLLATPSEDISNPEFIELLSITLYESGGRTRIQTLILSELYIIE